MSVHAAAASVVYGVPVTEADVTVSVFTRGCAHAATSMPFCGKCGSQTEITATSTKYLPGFYKNSKKMGKVGYKGCEKVAGSAGPAGVVGFLLADTSHGMVRADDEAPGMALSILEFCTLNGIAFDEKKLGIYLVLIHE